MKKLSLLLIMLIPIFALSQRATTSDVVNGGGSSYISNVSFSNDTMFFIGQNSAFNGYITGLANHTVDNIFGGNLQAYRFYTDATTGMYQLNDSLMFVDAYGTYSLNRLAQLVEAGLGDGYVSLLTWNSGTQILTVNDPVNGAKTVNIPIANNYISDISGTGNTITITGVGDAFSGSLTNVARLNSAQTFSAIQNITASGAGNYGLTVKNSSGSGLGLLVQTANTTSTALSVGTYTNTRFLVYGDGNVRATALPSGTQSNMLYIDPSGYFYVGAVPSGTGTVTSVGITSSDLTVVNSPITTSGNIELEIAADAVGPTELAPTAVSANTYTYPSTLTVDEDGRITNIATGITPTNLWTAVTGGIQPTTTSNEVYIGGIADQGLYTFQVNGYSYFDDQVNMNSSLDVTGTIYGDLLSISGTGSFTSTVTATNFILSSDRKLKKEIKDIDNTDWVDKIVLKQFRMKDDDTYLRYGVIAQELEAVNPDLVRRDSMGIYSVAYIDMLIAINERQNEKIETLEKKVEWLEYQVYKLLHNEK